ncbi:hypothetical protein QBC47DRAFT_354803 [Echria macrotheca]|uniref:Uncharacterized protein n=1 Tax=Echria macrotheca TaxID=438768 RepID=A0AAJ0B3M5_9PEZI|nr:hypothetical protein QBC47DRAFT_354803 [Echria macrotheca]
MQKTAFQLPGRPVPTRESTVWQANAPCRFFARGKCQNGQTCSFGHATTSPDPDRNSDRAQGETHPISSGDKADTRKQIPCRFFLSGSCLKAASCPFGHPNANLTDNGGGGGDLSEGNDHAAADADEHEPDDKLDNFVRAINGAIVQFGDGAAVLKAPLESDFSAVRITGLPLDSTQATAAEILKERGFDTSLDNIRVQTTYFSETAQCVADIRFEDPHVARNLCESTVSVTSSLRFEVVNPSLPRETSFQRVECKKVHCSWHRPLKTAWLNFRSEALAKKVLSKFSEEKYKVIGQAVKAKMSGDTFRRRGGYTVSHPFWTVMLTEVPSSAGDADVQEPIPQGMRPVHIEIRDAGFSYEMEVANATVKSKLMELGALSWWEDAPEQGGKRAKAKARFVQEGDAIRAAASLAKWKLPFSPTLRLDIQAIYSARFKVPQRIFMVVETEIGIHAPIWRSKYVNYTAYSMSLGSGQRTLRLEGADNIAFGEAKKVLEEILAGEVAMTDGKPIWTPGFASNGETFLKMKSVEESLGVAIVRNKRHAYVRIFGNAAHRVQAQVSLAELATQDQSTTHIVDLSDEQFAWAQRGGFIELKKTLGRKVAFDSISRRILVTGGEKDYQLALAIVDAKEEVGTTAAGEAETCCICWTEAEDPLQTSCKHTYCADCFERFCFAGRISSSDFTLRCAGDSGTCSVSVTLSELQEHLPSQTLERVLKESFTVYVSRRPETFQYCPTPDCSQIYRHSDTASAFTCPKCLSVVCTGCHDSHQGRTCAEHKDEKSGGYAALAEAKKRLGIQDCPKCTTPIEKTEGCNHMTCGGCKTHICWKCLETFRTGGECYDHLSRKHGGAFDYDGVF